MHTWVIVKVAGDSSGDGQCSDFFLKALLVDSWGSSIIKVFSTVQHLLEGGNGRQDGASNPNRPIKLLHSSYLITTIELNV